MAKVELQGGLQNVGNKVYFALGREDAEYSAPIIGSVNPLQVKHEVVDETALERTHPACYSLPEQWERWVQSLTDQKTGHAYFKEPQRPAVAFTSRPMPAPKVNRSHLSEVEEEYLRRYFRPLREAASHLARFREASPTSIGMSSEATEAEPDQPRSNRGQSR
jgi:hypothetical protein